MSTVTTLPFAGGELSSFDPQDNACFENTNTFVGQTWDPAVSRCDIACGGGSAGCKSPTWAAAPDFWFHVNYFPGSGGTHLQFYSGATVVLQAAATGDGGPWTISTLQAGVMTSVGTLTFPGSTRNVIDIRVVVGAAGRVEGYLAGTHIFTASGLDHSGFAGITQIQMRGTTGGFGSHWSQIICDTVPHIGDALVTLVEDTASVINTGWSGAVSGINEIVLDDSHSVTSSAAGDVSTYYKNGASLGTYKVVAICIGARAQLTPGSSTNLQLCLRTNGSNYFGPTTALDFGFQAVCASWGANPFTGAPWDTVTAAAAEVGMKSVA